MMDKHSKRLLMRDWPSYGVIAVSLALQLLLITQPLGFLLANLLPDDAFYYFQIARNIVAGLGSTFDGVNLTNGYHPLWMLILLPIYGVFSSGGLVDLSPIYAALGVAVILNVLTALLLLRLVSHTTDSPYVRAVAVMFWSLNPFVLYESLNGLETSLALFLLAVFMVMVIRHERTNSSRDGLVLGAVAGLLVLARLDMACFVLAFAGWTFYRRGFIAGIRHGLTPGLVAISCIGAWMIYNVHMFGMVLTSASAGNVLVNHALVVQDNGTGLIVEARATLYMLYTYGMMVLTRTGAPWVPFMILVLVFTYRRELLSRENEMYKTLLLSMVGGFGLLFLLNAGIRFTGRTWYFISANFFIALLMGLTFAQVRIQNSAVLRALAICSVLILATFIYSWKHELHNQMQNQLGMYESAQWMNTHLPAGERVGVFNAGIAAYFSHAHVVNLDGLVNNAAHAAMKHTMLWTYIEDERLSYIADFPIYITYRYRSFFGIPDPLQRLEQVARIPTPGGGRGDELRIYKIR